MQTSKKRPASRAPTLTACIAVGMTALAFGGCESLTEPRESGVGEFAARAPAGRETFAVDVSYWQGYLEERDVACWWESGVRHFISGIQDPEITVQQLQTAVNVGMTVDAYVPIYWDQSATDQVESALSVIAAFPIQRLWLDTEKPAGNRSKDELIDSIQAAVDACGSFPCGIYTRKVWWRDNVDDTNAFSYLPIWYAYYDGRQNFDEWYNPVFWYEGPFGGWSDPTGKQYDSSDTGPLLCGVEVDYDLMFTFGAQARLQAEVGTVTVDQAAADSWHSVTLSNTYVSPVVIIQPPSYYDYSPTTVRLLNVSTNGFQFLIDEWDYLDGAHGSETIGYLVVEAGSHRLSNGAKLEAGNVSVGQDFRAVDFSQTFTSTPVILTQVQSYAEDAAVTTQQRAASATGFQVKVQEEEASDDQHAQESVGYIAVERGSGLIDGIPIQASMTPDAVTHTWYSLGFAQSYNDPVLVAGLQTTDEDEPAALRYRNLRSSGAEVFVEEEKSKDAGVAHTSEVVGYLVLESGGGDDDEEEEEPPVAPTGLSPSGGVTITTSSVTLSCDAISGVPEYEFQIEYETGGSWSTYYTYAKTTNSATFWPQYDDTRYRWRVRARNAAGWGPWADWAIFKFGEVGTSLPPAPSGLDPSGGVTITTSSVTLSCNAISGVTQYEFEIEYESGGSWFYYYTYSKSTNLTTFWPQYDDTRYRWHVRARNAEGWGPWSDWAIFKFGDVGTDVPPAPDGLDPSGGVTITTSSVTLSCDAISGVTQYEFEIEYESGGSWLYYYTYSPTTNSTTFWPQVDDTRYRWHVRARNAEGWGPWSDWATFNFGDVGTDVPPAPTGLSPSGGVTITTSSVTLSCDAVSGANAYEFVIEYESGGSWHYYYTYSPPTSSTTFWPQVHDTRYRWHVRAHNAEGWGPWSAWATFRFN